MDKNDVLQECVELYLTGEYTFTQLQKEKGIYKNKIIQKLRDLGYTILKGYKPDLVINLKKAEDEFIKLYPNITLKELSKKFGVACSTLSSHFKKMGYKITNPTQQILFDENIFDVIDTEEKAYWLGFIYADGSISYNNRFELSLSTHDIDHLHKFNKFMNHQNDNVKVSDIKLNGKTYSRCRWFVSNKHLWNTLNNIGCVQQKSLILTFPNEEIFADKKLIKYFIQGYFDGDGCVSYATKKHDKLTVSILGTEQFLNKLQTYLPIENAHRLGYNNKKKNQITRVLSFVGGSALTFLDFIYNNTPIFLTRKYEKYKEFCRLYK